MININKIIQEILKMFWALIKRSYDYSQATNEGMKATKKTNGEINLCQCYVNLTVCDFGKLMLHFVIFFYV